MKNVGTVASPSLTSDATNPGNDASTRHRVLSLVLSRGPSTVAELAEQLQMTTAAVRRHVDHLAAAGSLEMRDQRVRGQRGRGRPSKVYVVTDLGRTGFRHDYDQFALQAIDELVRTGGPGAVERLAAERMRVVTEHFHQLRDESPEQDGTAALAKALSLAGYVAYSSPLASGDQLCQHHCPVSVIAARYPQLCEVETRVISELLETHVQRLATIAHGDGVCTTHVPRQVPISPVDAVASTFAPVQLEADIA